MSEPLGFNDTLEEEGFWWLPEDPENQIAGTLTFNPAEGAYLKLLGMLHGIENVFANLQRFTIFGVTKQGKPVTLLNCFFKNRQMNMPGIMTETHRVSIVAVGLHFEASDAAVFAKSFVRFEAIERWLDHNPFRLQFDENGQDVHLHTQRAPDETLGSFGEHKISASTRLFTEGTSTDRTVTVVSYLQVVPPGNRSLDWHFATATKLQELASLCSGYFLPLLSLRLMAAPQRVLNQDIPTEVDVFVQLIESNSDGKAETATPVVSAKELIASEPAALEHWFAQYEVLSPAIHLLFAVVGERQMYVNTRFLLAIQALEVFHRRTTEARVMDEEAFNELRSELLSKLPPKTPSAMKEKLKGLYAFANEPSLMQRLLSILKIVEAEFGAIPPGFCGKFARSVVDTRNYNTHFSQELEKKALNAAGMHWASRRIIFLLTVMFLMRIGMKANSIQAVLRRHQEFHRLWSEPAEPF